MEARHDERELDLPLTRVRRTSLTVAVEKPCGGDGVGGLRDGVGGGKYGLTRRPSLFVVKASPRVPQRSLFRADEEAGSPMVESPAVAKGAAAQHTNDDKENGAMNGATVLTRPSWLQRSAPAMHASVPEAAALPDAQLREGVGAGWAKAAMCAGAVERPLGLNDAWNNVLGENAAQAEAQRRGGKQLLLSRIATCPVYPDAARSGGHAPASASASCAATETPERLALQRLRNPPAERSKSSPAGPLGDYTLNRPAKTPTVMRVRRGSSYKIRRMRMSADPEELASMPAELAAAEEMVHQDVDPMEEREEMVHQDVHPTAAGSARAWEPASPPRVGPTPSVAATTAATPACPMTEMTLMNSMHDCLGMSTPPIGVRRPPRAPSSLMQLDASMRTPELHSTPAVGARPGAPPGAASFTLMRAACTGTAKSVHLVRHGESEYNRQLSFNKSWEDPQVFDPPLTRKGVEQCLELKERLRRLPNLQTAMWVCSPLSRAIETLLYSCPLDVEQLVARGQLVIKWEVTEFLQTTGDIGLPASCLRRKYPILAPAMDQLPEVWWYGNLESNNPFKRQCRAFEPKVAEAKRIAQFRGFLEESTERTVVAVGHSLFFKHFAGNGDSLSNCGILTMSI